MWTVLRLTLRRYPDGIICKEQLFLPSLSYIVDTGAADFAAIIFATATNSIAASDTWNCSNYCGIETAMLTTTTMTIKSSCPSTLLHGCLPLSLNFVPLSFPVYLYPSYHSLLVLPRAYSVVVRFASGPSGFSPQNSACTYEMCTTLLPCRWQAIGVMLVLCSVTGDK